MGKKLWPLKTQGHGQKIVGFGVEMNLNFLSHEKE
jgi:hypothetical protein